MKNIPVADVRNFVIMGHSGSGKTALTDAFAFKLGLTDRQGSGDAGTSVSDFTEVEKSRKISIFASPFSGEHTGISGKRYWLNFTDTPGYMDFHGQVLAAVRAADAALITVDAASGLQVGTRRAWMDCRAGGIRACGFVVTGLDRENASFDKTVESIQEAFGSECVPVMLPLAGGGVADIIAAEAFSADIAERAGEVRNALAEQAAATDDALIEKFLEGEALAPDELAKGLETAVASGTLFPIFICLPLSGKGVAETLNGIGRLFPSPEQHLFADTEGNEIPADPQAPFTGFVFRTAIDTFVGQINYVRIMSGTLKAQTELINTSNGVREMAGSLITTVGKKQIPVDSAGPGDIVAIPKLKDTHTGQTLAAPQVTRKLPAIGLPQPVHYVALTAKTQADEDKLGVALARIREQFPTIRIDRDTETKEVVMKGLGDVHVDVAVQLMKTQSNAAVDTSVPKVAYRESVTGNGEGHHRHKKQTGGRGQFGEVYLRVMPLPQGEEEWFHNKVVGGAIPGGFIPAVQKGVQEGLQAGAIARYPVQNVKVELYDGSYHDVDSSEVAFKIAGSRAFRDAMTKARPVLLEPIMTVKITVPDTFMGAVTGDLNHRRGRMLGMEMAENLQVITAEIPMAELFQYCAQLRSLTGGQGGFEMELARYDTVPSQIAQKIAAEALKGGAEQEED